MRLAADILLVTVNKTEAMAVLKVFCTEPSRKAQVVNIGKLAYHDLGVLNGQRIVMAQSQMGSVGLGASLQVVQEAVQVLNPGAVVMVGVAFGVDSEKQRIGGILVSEKVSLYEQQRVSTSDGNGKTVPRGSKVDASPRLISHFKACELYWDPKDARVQFGLMLAGEKLIDNLAFRDALLKLDPEAIGGEMEGAGLYVACQSEKYDWIIVKAICDWADGNKNKDKDANQELAATNAARFVFHALSTGCLESREKKKIASAKRKAGNKPGRAAVSVTIDRDRYSLDLDKQQQLVEHLAYIGEVTEDEVDIIVVESGSVKVLLETTERAAELILDRYVSYEPLMEMGVFSIEPKGGRLFAVANEGERVERAAAKQIEVEIKSAIENIGDSEKPVEPVIGQLADVLARMLKEHKLTAEKRRALEDAVAFIDDVKKRSTYSPAELLHLVALLVRYLD